MVWYSWNSDSETSATTTGTWGYWTNNYTATSTTNTWISWTSVSSGNSTGDTWVYWLAESGQVYVRQELPQISAEEQARRDAESRRLAEENRQRVEAARLEKEAADLKALELLQDIISTEDFAFYQKHGRLLVKGRKFDYLIQRDSGAVNRIEKGKVADLCMHLENHHAYSRHDNVIAMKLFLEGREDEFNREANLLRRRDPGGIEQELMRAINQ